VSWDGLFAKCSSCDTASRRPSQQMATTFRGSARAADPCFSSTRTERLAAPAQDLHGVQAHAAPPTTCARSMAFSPNPPRARAGSQLLRWISSDVQAVGNALLLVADEHVFAHASLKADLAVPIWCEAGEAPTRVCSCLLTRHLLEDLGANALWR